MLAYLAILMSSLLLCCGIAVDAGMLQMRKLQMQSAADAAALGAELEIERGTGNYVSGGQGDAAANGFMNGSGTTTVGISMRPATGAFAGYYDAVQATVSQQGSTSFLKLLGPNVSNIAVRSTALVTPCVYLTGSRGLTTSQLSASSATLNSTCPYYINSTAQVDNLSASNVLAENITGSASGSSWTSASAAPPRFNAQVMADPLASIVQPAAGSCFVTNNTTNATSSTAAYPATYCGTTTISCSSPSVTITMQPGLYIIAGTFKISNCTLNGTGVTFFFTQNPGGGYGQFLPVTTTMNLSAPKTNAGGGIPGVLVMTDRNWVPTSAQDFYLDRCTIYSDGIWYLTNSGLNVKSGVLIGGNYTGILAENLVVYASTLTTNSNYSGISYGNPFRPLGGLVE